MEQYFFSLSEELLEKFLWDPAYLERFAFLREGKCEWRLTGEMKQRVEGLLQELKELRNGEEATFSELERVLLLRLLFVLEEGKAYLTSG